MNKRKEGKTSSAGLLKAYRSQLAKKPAVVHTKTDVWADFIELICLAHPDGQVSISDIIQRLSPRERDLGEGAESDVAEIRALEDEPIGTESTRRAEVNDVWLSRVSDWWKVLETRSGLYGACYPFTVSTDEILLNKLNTNAKRNYLLLLLCSNLKLVDKRSQNSLAESFELMCLDAFRCMLPQSASVHQFGANSLNDDKIFGKGKTQTLWKKIDLLAKLINESLHPSISESNYPANNKGDDGLDLVGIMNSHDELPSKIVFFGQCTCERTWRKKQSESAYPAWSNKINLTAFTNNVIFIPHCYRRVDGKWINQGYIEKSLLVDRRRLLSFLGDHYAERKAFPARAIVKRVKSYKEAFE